MKSIVLILLLPLLLFAQHLLAQGAEKHSIHFDLGQASISLGQLDSIKLLAARTKKILNGRIVVHTFANDALEGDSNRRLSGKRAFLVQQCLEREGISLAYMQIENKVRHSTEVEGCGACAEILLTTDSNFFFQNIYHEQLADFLIEGSPVIAQTFWIRPFEDVSVSTKDGVLIRIPKGSLATKDSGLVKLDVRFLKDKWDMMLHSLATRSVDQEFLELNRAVHLEVTQYGSTLEMRNNQHITVIVPSEKYSSAAEIYQKEGTSWVPHKKSEDLRVGSFYGGDTYFCNGANSNLAAPNYAVPPTKPKYLNFDSVTAFQDEQLSSIQIRLDYLEEQKVNEKGKKQELSPAQKRNEYLLKGKKDRLLIAKEKMKIDAREKNRALEEIYYTELAAYNRARSKMQHSYLKNLDSLGSEQKDRAARCEQHKESILALRSQYGQSVYEQIAASLRNQSTKEKIGYWLQTNQLGWLSVGEKSKKEAHDAVPYRVISPVSAYKITAFLIFDDTKDVVIGEVLDERDIIFWEVPDGQHAKLLAVTKEGDNFLVAFHELKTSGNPIELEFKPVALKDVLGHLK